MSEARADAPAETGPGRIERVGWADFLARFTWQQGEHVTLVGPTGAGKTTLALALVELRQYVIAFGTKPKDRTLDGLVRRPGWRLVREWDRMPNVIRGACRVVFWPVYRTPDDQARQAYQIGQAMRGAFTQGGWCLFIDELWYLTNVLGMRRIIEALWTQGRSIDLSVIAGTQRPAHVPLLAYDQATHLFFWRDNDAANLKRISGLNGLNAALVRSTVAGLDRHRVLYVNTRTGDMAITKAPRK